MKGKEKLNLYRKIWKSISGLAVLIGAIASTLSIINFIHVNKLLGRVESLKSAQYWQISIDIMSPKSNDKINNHVTELSGKLVFQDTATSKESINLLLHEKNLEVVPFVKPVDDEKWWYAQASPIVRQNGSFEGNIFLGGKTGEGINSRFQIVVLMLPKGKITEGDRFAVLPKDFDASNIITVKRI